MNKFIKNWLDVVPDLIIIFDDNLDSISSVSLSALNLNSIVHNLIVHLIESTDFELIPTQIINEFKSGNDVYKIEISRINFNDSRYYYCKFLDITKMEILNAEVQASRDQQINIGRLTELAELAGGISHEISNPLTIVMAKISFLQSRLANIDLGLDKEKITESLAKIIHHSNRITKIIKGLKSFSKSDAKDSFVHADIKELLDEALVLTIESIKMKGILVDVEGIKNQSTVLCHPVQLVQVFVNLLKNSSDALEGSEFPVIKIFSEITDNSIKLFFQDNGPGVSIDVQAKIFNPFFTTKVTGKGTGLGLSLSHHIIHQHEGKFFLDVEKSNSCFCIELPSIRKGV
ncbi:MAG: ATP-binding protein [Pseudobdellovibrio sp.]